MASRRAAYLTSRAYLPESQGYSSPPQALADLVPYITRWSEERTCKVPVVQRHGGIAYPHERPGDRDKHGVLWSRVTSQPGRGRPQLGQMHSRRQRKAMTRLLCQVCGHLANRTTDGVLWLIGEDPRRPETWPDPLITAHPPVCTGCAARAVQACPHLRRRFTALRVRSFRPVAVRGALYEPRHPAPVRVAAVGVYLDDPRARWVTAGQLIVRLSDFSVTTLDANE
jgi:hypothetical protein